MPILRRARTTSYLWAIETWIGLWATGLGADSALILRWSKRKADPQRTAKFWLINSQCAIAGRGKPFSRISPAQPILHAHRAASPANPAINGFATLTRQ